MKLLFLGLVILTTFVQSNYADDNNGYIIKLRSRGDQAKLINFVQQRNIAASSYQGRITHRYDPAFFNGLAGTFTPAMLKELQAVHAGDIEYIERDGLISIERQSTGESMVGREEVQQNATWGLVRISKRTIDAKKDYTFAGNAGSGITVYVVDTGLDPSHPEFEQRASMGVSFVANETAVDLNGHGTHVAGTIGSKTWGVAKKVKLVGVKVLDAKGRGRLSNLIDGIQFVANNTIPGQSVLSMSLGGSKARVLDDAITAAHARGTIIIVAAGNSGDDACRYSPAGSDGAFGVGAIDQADSRASFSNFGRCAKIYAPGVNVTSTWLNGQTNTISGTSMACPHVSGIVALYLSNIPSNPASSLVVKPDEIYQKLKQSATINNGLRIAYNNIS